MANKKPNEVSGWKNELATLDSLPGETILDKNDKWQQLHNRLHANKGRKRAFWYWAAAGIVLLLTSSLWLINQNQSNVSHALAIQPAAKTIVLPNSLTNTTDTKAMATADVPTQTGTEPTQIAPQKQTDTGVRTIQAPQPIAVVETVMVAKAMPTVLSADTQSVAVITTPLPAKNKLKVVHINELKDPGLFDTKLYMGEDYMGKQSRFLNQPVYSTASPRINQIHFNISSTN